MEAAFPSLLFVPHPARLIQVKYDWTFPKHLVSSKMTFTLKMKKMNKKSQCLSAMTLTPGDVLSYSRRGIPRLPSALKSLTSVLSMGTGVTSSPSIPDY